MPCFILNFCQQDAFASQGGSARQPIAFRLHTDYLGMCVLGYLADQGLAISLGHPVLGLYFFLSVDASLKSGKPLS
jgi:hypothetical protein